MLLSSIPVILAIRMDVGVGVYGGDLQLVMEFQKGLAVLIHSDLC
jgi:hypothetical protein